MIFHRDKMNKANTNVRNQRIVTIKKVFNGTTYLIEKRKLLFLETKMSKTNTMCKTRYVENSYRLLQFK